MPLLRDNRLAHTTRLPSISQEEFSGKTERTIGSENVNYGDYRIITCKGNVEELTKCNAEVRQSVYGSDVKILYWAPSRCWDCRRRAVARAMKEVGA